MLKTRPLFLLVVTLCLLMVVVASYWVALLPQRSLRQLKQELLLTSGVVLDAKRARLVIGNGFGVVLDDISLTNPSDQPWQLTAKSATMPGVMGGDIALDQPVLDVDVSNVNAGILAMPYRTILRDGILKLRDPARRAVVAITDINGEISSEGAKGLKGQLAMVWGSQISDLVFDIEDLERFSASGSPMDVTLKSKAMLLGFSGQGRADKGFKLVGQATADAEEAATFFRWLGMPLQSLKGSGKFTAKSGISITGLSVALADASGKLGASEFSGQLTLAAGADRMALSGDLDISQLSILGPQKTASVFAEPWSEQVLPFTDAKAIEYNLNIKTAALVMRGRNLGGLAFKLTADGGNTSIGVSRQPFAGGHVEGNISLEGSVQRPDVFGAWQLEGVDAKLFMSGMFGFEPLEGPIDGVANFSSQGLHPAALISSLKGDFSLQSKSLGISGVDFKNLLAEPRVGWIGALTKPMQMNLATTLNEGVMILGTSDIQSAEVTLKPRGEIDVLRQVFDIQLQPKGSGTDPKMMLTGPWNAPTFSNTVAAKEKTAVVPPAN